MAGAGSHRAGALWVALAVGALLATSASLALVVHAAPTSSAGPARMPPFLTVPPTAASNEATACEPFAPAAAVAPAGAATEPEVVASVAVGSNPATPLYDPSNGYVYVTNFGSSNVTILSGTSVVATPVVGASPFGEAYDSYHGLVYVANEQSCTVSVINGTVVIANLSVGELPVGVTYDPADHSVYVLNAGSDTVSVLDGTTLVANVSVGSFPDAAAYDSANGAVYVANANSDNVSVLNGTTVVGTIAVGTDPDFVAYNAADQELYVTDDGSDSVTVVGGTAPVATVPVGLSPDSATVDASNGWVYVTNYVSNNVTIINGTTVAANPAAGAGPTDAVYDSSTGTVLVADYGSNSTTLLNGSTPVATILVGLGPEGVAFDPADGYLYVTDDESNAVSILGPTYLVTFDETGLSGSLVWSVTLGATTSAASTDSVAFVELPGLYDYTVAAPVGYRLANASADSPLLVVDSDLVVNLTFAPVSTSATAYDVTFVASGLMCMKPTWGVTLANSSQSTSGSSIVFVETNGTYNYSILAPSGYSVESAVPSSPLTVAGENLTVDVTFERAVSLSITFRESGLARGTSWCVTVTSTVCSSSNSIDFANVAPGSYAFNVTPVAGYTASPSAGTVSVTVRSVTVDVRFETPGGHGGGCGGMVVAAPD